MSNKKEENPIVEEQSLTPTTSSVSSEDQSNKDDLSQMATNMEAILQAIQAQRAEMDLIKEAISEEKKSREELNQQVNYIADKSRLLNWENKVTNANAKVLLYNLREYNGKIVVGWTDLKTNLIYKNEAKVWVENQTTTLLYDDGTTEDVPLRLWEGERKQIEAMYEGEELTKDGGRIIKLSLKDGRKFNIDVKFLN